jgi:hypothetical protein
LEVGTVRKLKAMHCYFGESPGRKCGDCCHLEEYEYHGRNYRKCKVYGVSHSEATDWARRWPACGQFGKPYTGPEVMGLLPRGKAKKVEEPMEGQLTLF